MRWQNAYRYRIFKKLKQRNECVKDFDTHYVNVFFFSLLTTMLLSDISYPRQRIDARCSKALFISYRVHY